MPAVLNYNRPLLPGHTRITRSADAVVVQITPDSAKRIVCTTLLPLLLITIFGLAGVSVVIAGAERDVRAVAILSAVALVASCAVFFFRALRNAHAPIVFRADACELFIHNRLDSPPDRFVPADRITIFQLRRTFFPSTRPIFALEVLLDARSAAPQSALSLLVSPSFETLDKIGRMLVAAMKLPEPFVEPGGWRSEIHPAPAATPSLAPPPSPPPSPDPVC